MEATRTLLCEQGYRHLRVADVAALSGVTPPTVRLRWPSKAELVHDAVFTAADEPPVPDTGSLVGDITAAVEATIVQYTGPELQAALLGLLEDLRRDPAMSARVRARLYEPGVVGFRQLLDRAIARGEIVAGDEPDPAVLMDAIAGAVLSRVLVPDPDVRSLAGDLVALLLRGIGATPQVLADFEQQQAQRERRRRRRSRS
jgi:AcrR family transcriptional regulator